MLINKWKVFNFFFKDVQIEYEIDVNLSSLSFSLFSDHPE
jgi:hypothetical protein